MRAACFQIVAFLSPPIAILRFSSCYALSLLHGMELTVLMHWWESGLSISELHM